MASITWVVLDDHALDADVSDLPEPGFVIAVDSGYSLAVRLGLDVDLLVGDMDSIPQDLRALADLRRVASDVHPQDKDATDLALALATAADHGDEVIVVGSAGGRLDHVLANVAAITDPVLSDVDVRARFGPNDLWVVRGERRLDVQVGGVVTVIAAGGDASGVHLSGVHWPLDGEDLPAGTTRGVSNVATGPVTVSVREGVLLVVHPRNTEH